MTSSLQTFSINNQEFEFCTFTYQKSPHKKTFFYSYLFFLVVKPMTAKIKMTITRNANDNIHKVLSDTIVQDCNVQISKEQFRSIFSIIDSLKRMWISWNHLSIRPKERVLRNKKAWWRYAYRACVEQRIRPYTWNKIRLVRRNHKQYTEIYKRILTNPNDTELKLDLQLYEDQLSIVNVVIARQQARLTVSLMDRCWFEVVIFCILLLYRLTKLVYVKRAFGISYHHQNVYYFVKRLDFSNIHTT